MSMPGAGSTSVKFFNPRGSCANANNDVLTGTRMTVTLIFGHFRRPWQMRWVPPQSDANVGIPETILSEHPLRDVFDITCRAENRSTTGRLPKRNNVGTGSRARPVPFPGIWRRGRDSNPRNGVTVYLLSKQAPSTTRPPLQTTGTLHVRAAWNNILALGNRLIERFITDFCRNSRAARPGTDDQRQVLPLPRAPPESGAFRFDPARPNHSAPLTSCPSR
jgi:hypothetical protein